LRDIPLFFTYFDDVPNLVEGSNPSSFNYKFKEEVIGLKGWGNLSDEKWIRKMKMDE